MTIGLGLCLFTFVAVFFPHLFTLKKFEQERAFPFGKESFQAFQIVDVLWIIVCIGFLWWCLASIDGYSDAFSLLAMFLALVTVPTAIYSGSTGIYPERTRSGYLYFRRYRNPAQQFLMSSKYSELKIVGRVQLILLIVVIGVSVSYVFL